ncbi:hypothetical protein F5B19DRAFT_148151 [Rostrohypoxylon terebratum]|nr:hypothetical protein F5B19DRAFT_148151 [Rostrohypoxylon terebratum]
MPHATWCTASLYLVVPILVAVLPWRPWRPRHAHWTHWTHWTRPFKTPLETCSSKTTAIRKFSCNSMHLYSRFTPSRLLLALPDSCRYPRLGHPFAIIRLKHPYLIALTSQSSRSTDFGSLARLG